MLTDEEHDELQQRLQDAALELQKIANQRGKPAAGHLYSKSYGVLLALDYTRSYARKDER